MKTGEVIFRGKTKKGLHIVIRYPLENDLNILLKYINKLSDERTFVTFQGEHLTLKEEKKYLSGVLRDIKNNKAVNLLVFRNKNLIGIGEIKLHEKVESHIGELGISISKEHRSSGIGSILMEYLIKEAHRRFPNMKIVHLYVYSENNIAKGLYEKFGFEKYGILPKGIYYRGKYIDKIHMYKNIQ